MTAEKQRANRSKTSKNCPFTAFFDNVIIKRDKPVDRLTSKSIIIIGQAQRDSKMRSGIVVATGPGRWVDGHYLPMDVKVGTRVVFPKYVGMNPKLNGQEFLLISASEVLGKLSKGCHLQA